MLTTKETAYEYEERANDVVGLGDTKEKVSEKVNGHTAGESLGKTKDRVTHGGLKQASLPEVVYTIDRELDLKQISTPAYLTGIEACTQVSLLFHVCYLFIICTKLYSMFTLMFTLMYGWNKYLLCDD